jgi:imidazoleglycerol-phosphate dehydratase
MCHYVVEFKWEDIMRNFQTIRKTKETSVEIALDLNGGDYTISTGIGFFDHMLELFAYHSGFGLSINAVGDTRVDAHHTVEDVGIVLGEAFYNSLGNKVGIKRFSSVILPMDESLAEIAVDVSGRAFLVYNADFPVDNTGTFDLCLVEEFFRAFTTNFKITLHINLRYGRNAHHMAEAIFKGVGRALQDALKVISDKLPSTKGYMA